MMKDRIFCLLRKIEFHTKLSKSSAEHSGVTPIREDIHHIGGDNKPSIQNGRRYL